MGEACGDDAELRSAVETLIRADAGELIPSQPDVWGSVEALAAERRRLPAGTRLGPYEVRSLLGEGGMGEVYRARDTRLGGDVAIKVLLWSAQELAERRERFHREGRAMAALSHGT